MGSALWIFLSGLFQVVFSQPPIIYLSELFWETIFSLLYHESIGFLGGFGEKILKAARLVQHVSMVERQIHGSPSLFKKREGRKPIVTVAFMKVPSFCFAGAYRQFVFGNKGGQIWRVRNLRVDKTFLCKKYKYPQQTQIISQI